MVISVKFPSFPFLERREEDILKKFSTVKKYKLKDKKDCCYEIKKRLKIEELSPPSYYGW